MTVTMMTSVAAGMMRRARRAVEAAVARCAPVHFALAQQQPGDDEPRDDEEDLDADVATAEPGNAGVVDEGQEDGDGAQALHVGAELPVTWRGSRLVAGGGVPIDRD